MTELNSSRELVDAPPSTSRAAGDRKQTADLTAAQISQNQELIDKFRGKMVSHCSHPLTNLGHGPGYNLRLHGIPQRPGFDNQTTCLHAGSSVGSSSIFFASMLQSLSGAVL